MRVYTRAHAHVMQSTYRVMTRIRQD